MEIEDAEINVGSFLHVEVVSIEIICKQIVCR